MGSPVTDFGHTSPDETSTHKPVPDGSTVSTGRLLTNLVSIAQEHGRIPTPDDVERYGDYPVEWYFDEFGSWEATLDASGLVDSPEEK